MNNNKIILSNIKIKLAKIIHKNIKYKIDYLLELNTECSDDEIKNNILNLVELFKDFSDILNSYD
jgi:hypothetical protein